MAITQLRFRQPISIFLMIAAFNVHYPVYAQFDARDVYIVKVKTDSGVYKGDLRLISDSAIWISYGIKNQKFPIPLNTIQLITVKIKRPFLNIAKGSLLGFGSGILIVPFSYLEYPYQDPFQGLSFFEALSGSMFVGAVAGCLGGAIEAIFVRTRIRINKSQILSEQQKSTLQKYIFH